ncbi:MAG: DUF4251 domain-containing protein [Eudoraea sp.]|nr:DUF4251 domain-containing protein [Eudoraea sp.]
MNTLMWKKMGSWMTYCCFVLFIFSCGSSSSVNNDSSKIADLRRMVTKANYEITSNWAFPLMTQGLTSIANAGLLMPGSNASSIDLIGNPNYLRVIGDSVSVSLPYFGERQMGGGYNNTGSGLSFDGIPDSYETQWDERKQRYQIKFQVKQRTETLQFNILLFTNLKSDIKVNSTHRTSIGYNGVVAFIPDKEKKTK